MDGPRTVSTQLPRVTASTDSTARVEVEVISFGRRHYDAFDPADSGAGSICGLLRAWGLGMACGWHAGFTNCPPCHELLRSTMVQSRAESVCMKLHNYNFDRGRFSKSSCLTSPVSTRDLIHCWRFGNDSCVQTWSSMTFRLTLVNMYHPNTIESACVACLPPRNTWSVLSDFFSEARCSSSSCRRFLAEAVCVSTHF